MKRFVIIFLVAAILIENQLAFGDGRLCISPRGVIMTRTKCLRKETVLSAKNLGRFGLAGSNGELAVFGSSESNAVVSSSVWLENFLASLPSAPSLPIFHNFTVNEGVTLTVPSGTIIRCNGTATINGTIAVTGGAEGSHVHVDKPDFSIVAAYSKIYGLSSVPGGQGIARTGAVMGQVGVASIKQYGGALSRGLVLDTDDNFYQASIVARSIFTSGIQGGAGGAGNLDVGGGMGGGKFVLLCKEGIRIGVNGTIRANGYDITPNGGGGGGGGVIILASKGGITNQGTLQAKGGSGGSAGWSPMVDNLYYGPGGGGGGGLINLISPSAITLGNTDVTGGAAGASVSAVFLPSTASYAMGGGTGGASYANAGDGGTVNTNGSVDAAGAGDNGAALTTSVDPLNLL